jgi:hypothetical protein
MAIFQAFFDESGKFKDKRVISFCGLCSPPTRVQQFEDEWKGLLRHYGLGSLTMKHALRRKRKFTKTVEAKSVEERNAVLEPFSRCIRKHFELGLAVSVDVDAYKKWPAQAKRKIGGSEDPFYLAFLTATGGARKYILGEDRLSLICDDDQETAMNCYRLYQRVKALDSEARQKFVSITFADDNEFVPLQAADLLASLSRLEAGRLFHKDYYEYMPLFKNLTAEGSNGGMKWVVRFYDQDYFQYLNGLWNRRPVTAL